MAFQSQRGPSWTSVLDSCLPAFWGVCLAKAALRSIRGMVLDESSTVPFATNILASIDSTTVALENWVLPAACAAIMATSFNAPSSSTPSDRHTQTESSSLIMASIVAAMTSSQSILSGLLAGWLVAHWTERLLYWCILRHVTTTMTNMVTTGGVGALVALFLVPVAPFLRLMTQSIRWLILATITTVPPDARLLRGAVGFLWGCLSCYACKVGGYHAVHLPLILIEMELGDASFLGAIDELALVLVCAGVCLGNLVAHVTCNNKNRPSLSGADVALSRRGLYINLAYGDFIEICYPFMQQSRLINLGGYLGSGLSVAWLVWEGSSEEQVPKSLAYLPLALSIPLAGAQWERMAGASAIALTCPFLLTLLHYAICRIRPRSCTAERDRNS